MDTGDKYLDVLINLKKIDYSEVLVDQKFKDIYHSESPSDSQIDEFMKHVQTKYGMDMYNHIQYILAQNVLTIIKKFPKYDFNNVLINKLIYFVLNLGSLKLELLTEKYQTLFAANSVLFVLLYKIYYDRTNLFLCDEAKKIDEIMLNIIHDHHIDFYKIVSNEGIQYPSNAIPNMIKSIIGEESRRIKDIISKEVVNEYFKFEDNKYVQRIAYGLLFPRSIKGTTSQQQFDIIFLLLCYISLTAITKTTDPTISSKSAFLATGSVDSVAMHTPLVLEKELASAFKDNLIQLLLQKMLVPKQYEFVESVGLSSVIKNEMEYATDEERIKVSKILASIDTNLSIIGGSIFCKLKKFLKKISA